MENWNQDLPERYSKFRGLYKNFRVTENGPGPTEKAGSLAPTPRSSKVAESMYKYLQTHIEVLKLCIIKKAKK